MLSFYFTEVYSASSSVKLKSRSRVTHSTKLTKPSFETAQEIHKQKAKDKTCLNRQTEFPDSIPRRTITCERKPRPRTRRSISKNVAIVRVAPVFKCHG